MATKRLRSTMFTGVLVVIAFLVLALVACQSAGVTPTVQPQAQPKAAAKTEPVAAPKAAPNSPELQALIDGARKEGRLKLVWEGNTLGGMRGVELWSKGLNNLYGLDVKVEFTTGDDMAKNTGRLVQEYKAKVPAYADVFLGAAGHIVSAADALEPVNWTSWAPNIQKNPKLVGPNGVAVEIATRNPGITYNTKKIAGAAIPKSMEDLLKPQYKGRIASTPYAANFDRLAAPEGWGESRTIDYVSKFAPQVAGLIGCGEENRVVTGEFDLFALQCGGDQADKLRSQGAPIDAVMATDAPLVLYWYMGVPKNASNPNAAKLWINYMLSREAQDIQADLNFTDHFYIEGSKTAETRFKALQAAGVKFMFQDTDYVLRNNPQDIARVRTQVQKLLAGQ